VQVIRDLEGGKSAISLSEEEQNIRIQLASCYQLFDHLGWAEAIFNHISVRVPGPDRHFLINPFGKNYSEVCASNLVKVDIEGNLVGQGASQINQAGFIIHGAIHEAREDAHCVIHTHTTAGSAVSVKRGGLKPNNFYGAMLSGTVAYHDFEGIVLNPAEKSRIVADLGDKQILILRNHGLLVAARTIAQAYHLTWALQRACEIQCQADAMNGSDTDVGAEIYDACANFMNDPDEELSKMVFDAAVRRMVEDKKGQFTDFRA
jgi:ribulose-5-phosphate 4-epimerase/fuculose-1-phosphate aldolase